MNNNRIVIEPAAKIREVARAALQGRWVQVVIFMGIYYLLTNSVQLLIGLLFSTTQTVTMMGEPLQVPINYGGWLYALLISGPMSWGLSAFLLDFFRNHRAQYSTVLEGFSHFGKALCLSLLATVKVFLWSMLFVIPGIIASINYSQAFFVCIDHPDYSASRCIEESKRLMRGNKWNYFYLHLTFIGWALVAAVPTSLLSTLLTLPGLLAVLGDFVMAIPMLFLNAYIDVAEAAYYELANDNLVIMDAARPGNGW